MKTRQQSDKELEDMHQKLEESVLFPTASESSVAFTLTSRVVRE
jgi:hypothetical protein